MSDSSLGRHFEAFFSGTRKGSVAVIASENSLLLKRETAKAPKFSESFLTQESAKKMEAENSLDARTRKRFFGFFGDGQPGFQRGEGLQPKALLGSTVKFAVGLASLLALVGFASGLVFGVDVVSGFGESIGVHENSWVGALLKFGFAIFSGAMAAAAGFTVVQGIATLIAGITLLGLLWRSVGRRM